MSNLNVKTASSRPAIVFAVGVCMALASSAAEPTKLFVRPGSSAILDSAPCLRTIVPAAGGAVEAAKVSDTKTFAIYTAPASQNADVQITIESGAKDKADKSGCESAVQKQFTVTSDLTPQIPDSALGKSFNVLVTAFVLALLLESAFALLFNWRFFLEFFVGKAWRTPIMFAGALAVVLAFDLDLMAALFEAYSPRLGSPPPKGSWFTAALTAMILAGGSVGVNRVLVGLGFRSQIRPDASEPLLKEDEAWMSIQVKASSGKVSARVDVEIVGAPDSTKADIPTVVGILRPRNLWQRLKDVLFPSGSRLPRSGGRKVSTSNCYRITVTDLRVGGKLYDAMGREISKIEDAQLLRFGPRAIVDFEIVLEG